jgi:hypothetical protein
MAGLEVSTEAYNLDERAEDGSTTPTAAPLKAITAGKMFATYRIGGARLPER